LINHLLVVDPKKRYTAKQALSHPWIASNNVEEPLPQTSIQNLKSFNAKRKWKRGINSVLALGRFQSLGLASKMKKLAVEKKP